MSYKVMRYPFLLSLLLLLSSIGGVYAAWTYALSSANPVEEGILHILEDFYYKPEDILPTETPGQNFMDLLNSILENDKNGLNSKKDSYENAIKNDKDGLLHCKENITGGNQKHLFVTEANRLLAFIAEYISDTEFHFYMYTESDAVNGVSNSARIKVFKTIVHYIDGTWVAEESQFGYATAAYFAGTSIESIDVYSWVRQ